MSESSCLTLDPHTFAFFQIESETVNLDTATLLKEASVYARDLFFTLNLTSRQERYQQQRVHVNGGSSGDGSSKGSIQSTSTYHNNHYGSNTNVVRRTVSIIQSRKKKIILLSFGSIRAVAGLHDVLLFDAHLPTVRDFAHDLRNTFQSKNNTTPLSLPNPESTPSNAVLYNQNHGSNINEPYELLFLECVLRDTVDSYHRRLRLFEPIGTSILAIGSIFSSIITWILPLRFSLIHECFATK